MIGIVETDEALWVLGCNIDTFRFTDVDSGINRGMQDQQRGLEPADMFNGSLVEIVEKLLLDGELAPGKIHFCFSLCIDGLDVAGKLLGDMLGIGRGADGDNTDTLRHGMGRRQDCCATQAMTDQQGWRHALFAQVIRRLYQVLNIGRKIGVGEITIAATEPGEVEAHDRIAASDQ